MSRKKKDIRIVFDFDGVLCSNNHGDYSNAPPYPHAIDNVNKAYHEGYYIIICTARYGLRNPGSQYQHGYEEAVEWLRKHDVRFHELRMGKPAGDLYVDDKACVVQSELGDKDWINNFWPSVNKLVNKNPYGESL